MIQQEFTISLRVKHPVYSDRLIAESLGMTPEIAHGQGAPRTTPTGRPLEGSYKETYCVFGLIDQQSGWFVEGVRGLLPSLAKHREFLSSIADTGGSSELYIGVFVDGGDSAGFSLDSSTMAALADLHVKLAAEFYWKGIAQAFV